MIQRLYLLVRRLGAGGQVRSAMLASDPMTKELFKPWPVDVRGDCMLTQYQFTRAPLVVDCVIRKTGEVGAWDHGLRALGGAACQVGLAQSVRLVVVCAWLSCCV